MKNMRVWSGLLLIFVVGVIIGVLTSTIVIRQHLRGFMKGGPARATHHIALRLIEGLDLTEAQRERIDGIIEETAPGIEKLSAEFFESMKARTDEQISMIREVLDDAQKAEFDRRRLDMEERFKRVRGERGRRRPGLPGEDRPGPPPGT